MGHGSTGSPEGNALGVHRLVTRYTYTPPVSGERRGITQFALICLGMRWRCRVRVNYSPSRGGGDSGASLPGARSPKGVRTGTPSGRTRHLAVVDALPQHAEHARAEVRTALSAP